MKTTLHIFALAVGLFGTTLEGTVKVTNAADGSCTICVVPPAEVEVYIKQSTTETVALPNASELAVLSDKAGDSLLVDPSMKRWMATVMFRSYWDYRDTAYMVDALHFLSEKFLSDMVGALEKVLKDQKISSAQQDRAVLKILEQQMGMSGKFWFFGSSTNDDDSGEDCCGESSEASGIEGVEEAAQDDFEACGCDGEDLFDLAENNDEGVAEIVADDAHDSTAEACEKEDSSDGLEKPTLASVIDFYHIVLHRIAHLLTPKDAMVQETMRILELDLMLALHDVSCRYGQQTDLGNNVAMDSAGFARIREMYEAMLLVGRDFLHKKLCAAWAPTIQTVDAIVKKTGKNLDSLNYIDFELWLNDQQQ